jgi:CubicO group peptidase (beta-lactamase class C family)
MFNDSLVKKITLSLLCCATSIYAAEMFRPDKAEPAISAGMDATRLARIPVRMNAFVEQGTAAGFVTLIARHGHVASLDAVGYQDHEAKTPMRTDSIFRIKSMTKPMTAAGIMILADEARLSLLDPVEQYLPEFKGIKLSPCGLNRGTCELVNPSRLITIRDLMTHTSGLPDSGGPAGASVVTLEDLVKWGAGHGSLVSEPGAVWRYSNLGFQTLGRLIEVISGQPYDLFMADRIFKPLGMKDTHYFLPAEKESRLAAVYMSDAAGHLNRAAPDPAVKIPGPDGGLYSTAPDQARFYQMLLNKGTLNGQRILSLAAVEAMTTNQTGELMGVEFSPGLGMGFGFGVVKEPLGTYRYQSVGAFMKGGAYRTLAWGDPARDLLGIIMYQRTNGGGDTAMETNAFITLAEAAVDQ